MEKVPAKRKAGSGAADDEGNPDLVEEGYRSSRGGRIRSTTVKLNPAGPRCPCKPPTASHRPEGGVGQTRTQLQNCSRPSERLPGSMPLKREDRWIKPTSDGSVVT